MGLLCGDVEAAAGDVAAAELCHVGVAQGGEGAEAEEVAGLGEGSCLADCLLVWCAVGADEGDFGAVGGDVVAVEGQEFFFGEEDDGFFEDAEFGAVSVYLGFAAVTFADGPVEEPFEVIELFLCGVFLKVVFGAEEVDEFGEAFFVEV